MEKTFFDYISNDGNNMVFGLPFTEELRGRAARLPEGTEVCFGDELAVKCDDDLFLAEAAGRLLLVEELADESLTALDAGKAASGASSLPEELEGWTTDFSFASGYVLTAEFRAGTLTLRHSPEPVIANPFGSGGALEAPKAQAPLASLGTLSLQAVKTGDKRFLLRFPETGEIIFLNARRFLLYGILRGRIAAGFVEVPAKE